MHARKNGLKIVSKFICYIACEVLFWILKDKVGCRVLRCKLGFCFIGRGFETVGMLE